jgi:hypothetical protein
MSSAPIALDRVEVAVHTSCESYPPATTGQYGSYFPYNANSQSQDKGFVLGNGSDVESDVERGSALLVEAGLH